MGRARIPRPMAIDVREIARKAASRVLSERQLAPKPVREAAPAQPVRAATMARRKSGRPWRVP